MVLIFWIYTLIKLNIFLFSICIDCYLVFFILKSFVIRFLDSAGIFILPEVF